MSEQAAGGHIENFEFISVVKFVTSLVSYNFPDWLTLSPEAPPHGFQVGYGDFHWSASAPRMLITNKSTF
jgi:hypothetical protein